MNDEKSEVDVLKATTIYLFKHRNVIPFRLSVSHNPRLNINLVRDRLVEDLKKGGVPISWVNSVLHNLNPNVKLFLDKGPDIIGASELEYWQIECKGSGKGKTQTQRNNFDRALASAVSYYIDEFGKLKPYIGLALPATKDYINQLHNRVKKPLRQRLNLSVFLYNPKTQEICHIAPDEEYD